MRIIGLDVGDKKIGVAISDQLNLVAQGLGVIHRSSDEIDIAKVKDLIEKYKVGKVVIGLPKNMNGTLGPQSKKVKEFGNIIKQNLEIDIDYWDERLSTVAAERVLINADVSRKKRKNVIDKLAAVVILQGYLDLHSKKKIY